ncbi:protein scarlet [Anabrus simplex]|uniref:protein scarlet n=1 Tax=Anabrus simplex TaxID=316456 RepID=UPI0035A2B834
MEGTSESRKSVFLHNYIGSESKVIGGERYGSQGQGYGYWAPEEDGVSLTWKDVNLYTKSMQGNFFRRKAVYKRIVTDASGAVKPGTLVAIMGGSGAGKSSLMMALAHRNQAGTIVDGDIRVNGRPVGDFMQRLSGFMHQEDLFVSSLTVREHLNFMAQLKFDRRTPSAKRRLIVEDLMKRLGLANRADTRIGTTGEGKVLSGGEKKRLAFGTELLTDPPLLFCDEPTTGLDSYSAQMILQIMKFMASNGKTILCTIHQPSSELFNMFHQLVLVADGRIAFIGTTADAINFFESQGYQCPRSYNPAEFFIRTLAVVPGSEETSRRAIKRLCDHYAVSDAAHEVDVYVRLQCHLGSSTEVTKDWDKEFKAPFSVTKLTLLIYRSFLQIVRDPTIQGWRMVQKIAIAVMAGLCYIGTIPETQTGVQSVQGALFIFVTENTFSPMYSVLSLFPQEMPLFAREYRSGLYATHIYYVSKMIAMLPGLIVEPTLFIMVAYWLVGLRNTIYAFCMTAFIATLTMNVSTACGCFFGSAFESVSVAMACLVPFDYVLMITSGLFVKLSSLPPLIGWAQYLSWLMYSNEALSIVQWEGVHNITCEMSDPELPCITGGEEVLDKYSFSSSHFERDLVAMISLYCIFHLLAFFCLWYRTRSK